AITLGTGDGLAALNGTTARSAVGGVATFADLNIDLAGIHYLTAIHATLGTISSNTFTIAPAALAHFFFESAGGGEVIGTQAVAIPFNIQITASDVFNNTVTNFTGTVQLTTTGSGISAGSITEAFSNGVLASHSVTLN